MEPQGQRRIIIGEIIMADRKGLYASPSIVPDGCAYLRTFGEHLRKNKSSSLNYDDFDLYINQSNNTYCYRFWRRSINAQTGKETARSYAEPVVDFATEDEAVQHALSVFRGEQSEYMSPDLQEWRQQAQWLVASITLAHRAQANPSEVPELYRMVKHARSQVHPAARLQWDGLERTLELALQESEKDVATSAAKPAEWSEGALWGRKLEKAWKALEKAHNELATTIKVPPVQDPALLSTLQAALIDYLDVARRIRTAYDKASK